MKKIPTLFKRVFEGRKIIGLSYEMTKGCEDAFLHGLATVKIDGSCRAVIDGEFYKRYDAKKGKKPPTGAIPCCDPDPVTGHWPHWVKCDRCDPNDKWFWMAYDHYVNNFPYLAMENGAPCDGTYEAIGPHFNGNPYGRTWDILVRHGVRFVSICRNFESVREYLSENEVEGLVFWLNGEPVCKIKRSDFGLPWPIKE